MIDHCDRFRIRNFRDSEIRDFNHTAFHDHDVLRLDIPVNDAFHMGVVEGKQNLGDELRRLPPVKFALAVHIFAKRDAADIFHHDEFVVGFDRYIENFHDIRMIQHRDSLGFVDKAAQRLCVIGDGIFEHFERDALICHEIGGLIDDCHSADADGAVDFVSSVEDLTDIFFENVHFLSLSMLRIWRERR